MRFSDLLTLWGPKTRFYDFWAGRSPIEHIPLLMGYRERHLSHIPLFMRFQDVKKLKFVDFVDLGQPRGKGLSGPNGLARE